MLTTDVAASKLMGSEHQNEASLLPTDEDVAWVEQFLESLTPEIYAILRRPTARMASRLSR
jgi:hypothetical protein